MLKHYNVFDLFPFLGLRAILLVIVISATFFPSTAKSQIRTFEEAAKTNTQFGILYGGFHYIRTPIYNLNQIQASSSAALREIYRSKKLHGSEKVLDNLDSEIEYRSLLEEGIINMEQHQFLNAEKLLIKAKQIQPHENDLLITLSQLYFDMNCPEKAVEVCKELSRIPNGEIYQNNLGVAYGRMGDWKLAEETFQAILNKHSQEEVLHTHAYFALYNLGWCYLKMGKFKAARELYPRLYKCSKELARHFEFRLRSQNAW